MKIAFTPLSIVLGLVAGMVGKKISNRSGD